MAEYDYLIVGAGLFGPRSHIKPNEQGKSVL